jgi:hypothetical protein
VGLECILTPPPGTVAYLALQSVYSCGASARTQDYSPTRIRCSTAVSPACPCCPQGAQTCSEKQRTACVPVTAVNLLLMLPASILPCPLLTCRALPIVCLGTMLSCWVQQLLLHAMESALSSVAWHALAAMKQQEAAAPASVCVCHSLRFCCRCCRC